VPLDEGDKLLFKAPDCCCHGVRIASLSVVSHCVCVDANVVTSDFASAAASVANCVCVAAAAVVSVALVAVCVIAVAASVVYAVVVDEFCVVAATVDGDV